MEIKPYEKILMKHLCEQQATIRRFLTSRDCADLNFGKEMTAKWTVSEVKGQRGGWHNK